MRLHARVLRNVFAAICASLPILATAVPVAPGGFQPAVAEPDPIGGTSILGISAPFASPSFSGMLYSEVISGDTSNPYGGLTFTYQLDLTENSLQAATQMTISSFANFLTDISYYSPPGLLPGGVAPTYFSRSSEGGGIGQVVRFHFLTPSIGPGQNSALMVVQTSASAWNYTTAGLSDGVTLNVTSLAPIAVPEPAALSLVLLGFGLLCLRRRN